MAQSKPDLTKFLSWNQFGIIVTIVIALLGLAGWAFHRSIQTGLDGIQTDVRSLKDNDLKSIKESISDAKGALQRQMDKLDERLTRLEFPQFREKAAAAGIKTSLPEFKQYQVKAASLGLIAPEYAPVRLDRGFTIASRGVLPDGTSYDLLYTVDKVQDNKVSIKFGGTVTLPNGNKYSFSDNVANFPLIIGSQISLNRLIGESIGVKLPELRLAVLGRPTPNTLILASGSPAGSS